MESKDIQKLVFSKFKTGESSNKEFRDLKGVLSRTTVFKWCNIIKKTSSIKKSHPGGLIQKVRESYPKEIFLGNSKYPSYMFSKH